MGDQQARAFTNDVFDAVVRIGPGVRWSSFRVCGVVGLLAGVGLALLLARLRGQSPAVILPVTVAAVGSFLSLVMIRARITGMVRLICFHDQLAALGGAAALLLVLRQPVLAYLDIAVLGMGIFVAGGRVGCLLVGCCHGRPANWGPRYGPEHVREGFLAEYAGVRLLPVPLFETVTLTGVVGVGSTIALSGAAPGSVLVWYALGQVFVRFWLELLRGDERPAARAVSEAQWTAVAVAGCLAVVTLVGGSDVLGWLTVAALAVMVPAVVVMVRSGHGGLGGTRHVREVFGVVRAAERAPDEILIWTTHLGIRISAQHRGNHDRHYAFSRPARSLTWSEAVALGRIVWLAEPSFEGVLARTDMGVYHLSVRAGAARTS